MFRFDVHDVGLPVKSLFLVVEMSVHWPSIVDIYTFIWGF